ncbi:transmembrane protein 252 [Gallus gallus]|nr:transmembrane protein 252 [Gallus gallus]XP_046791631.1 transmembrane protein 252 [Gallus gallus]|eukprot:XP_003642963.2 transmembrane protein 252 [Gallus gallus]
MKKVFFSLIRLSVLLLSFSIICLGVLCIYTGSPACGCGNKKLVAYCLLTLGLLLLVAGVFWSTVHEAMKYGGLSSIFMRNPDLTELRVSTIDRPDFYPPSYEDSTDPGKQTFPLPVGSAPKEQEVINMPPPLYSESSTESITEMNEPEQPPPYELPGQVLSPVRESDACALTQDSVC